MERFQHVWNAEGGTEWAGSAPKVTQQGAGGAVTKTQLPPLASHTTAPPEAAAGLLPLGTVCLTLCHVSDSGPACE